MNMKKIGIIINLNSRRYKLAKNNPKGVFEKIGKDYVIVRYTRTIDELVEVADEFKTLNIDYVAPSGGDGTLHHTITQFSKVYTSEIPPLLILKGGTMNNVATSIQLKGDAISILKRAVANLEKGITLKCVTRKTMKVDDRYCFLFGNGLTTDFLDTYYKIGKSYTKLVQLVYNTIYEAFSNQNSKLFRGFTGTIKCDGDALPITHILGILIGTVETIGFGFYPLFRANDDSRSFHAIICAMKPRELAKNVLKLKRGIPIKHHHFIDRKLSSLEIISNAPFAYTMDGDLYYADGYCKVTLGIPVSFVVV